jgi:hypothetical protein
MPYFRNEIHDFCRILSQHRKGDVNEAKHAVLSCRLVAMDTQRQRGADKKHCAKCTIKGEVEVAARKGGSGDVDCGHLLGPVL